MANDSARTCQSQPYRAESKLPPDLTRARQTRQLGFIVSTLFVGSGLVLLASIRPQLSQLQGASWTTIALFSTAPLAAFAVIAAQESGKDRLMVEIHNGRLYVQWNLPPRGGASIEAGAIEVRPAGKKGNGAFATKDITQGTYLGDYEGELIDEQTFWQRYPSGVADYCMGIDSEWTLDGRDRAADTRTFSPVHMNHSALTHNVSRRCSRADQCVSFYASRDIQAGEELLLNYGKTYWTGREDKILD